MMHVILVGPPGSGKTTVGKLLSKRLKLVHLDTDELFLDKYNKKREQKRSLTEIFLLEGEPFFRAYEMKVLKSISLDKGFVLSLGGGTITTEENRALIKKFGTVFYLDADLDILMTHLKKIPGYVQGRDKNKAFSEIMKNRQVLYSQMADFIVPINKMTPERIAQNILDKMEL